MTPVESTTKRRAPSLGSIGKETSSLPMRRDRVLCSGSANCGGRYRATQPGDRFECRLTRRAVPAKTASNRAAETRAAKPDAVETIVICVQPEVNVTWQAVRVIGDLHENKLPVSTALNLLLWRVERSRNPAHW